MEFPKQNYSPSAFPQPATKRNVDSRGADFYPTPNWVTEALLDYETFEGSVWEPACGDGEMSKVLTTSGLYVDSSDLYDRGFGEVGIDFLTLSIKVDNIVTNPPYVLAEKFILHALACSERKVAMLLRLAFLESAGRFNGLFLNNAPSRVLVFSERVTMYPKDVPQTGGGTTAYAWMIWDKSHSGPCELGWISPGRKPKAKKYRPVPSGISLSDLGLG